MASFSREDYIYYARLSEQGERYEDMIRYMKEVSRVSSLSLFRIELCLFTLITHKENLALIFDLY